MKEPKRKFKLGDAVKLPDGRDGIITFKHPFDSYVPTYRYKVTTVRDRKTWNEQSLTKAAPRFKVARKNPRFTTAQARDRAWETPDTKPLRKSRLYALAHGRYPESLLHHPSHQADREYLRKRKEEYRREVPKKNPGGEKDFYAEDWNLRFFHDWPGQSASAKMAGMKRWILKYPQYGYAGMIRADGRIVFLHPDVSGERKVARQHTIKDGTYHLLVGQPKRQGGSPWRRG